MSTSVHVPDALRELFVAIAAHSFVGSRGNPSSNDGGGWASALGDTLQGIEGNLIDALAGLSQKSSALLAEALKILEAQGEDLLPRLVAVLSRAEPGKMGEILEQWTAPGADGGMPSAIDVATRMVDYIEAGEAIHNASPRAAVRQGVSDAALSAAAWMRRVGIAVILLCLAIIITLLRWVQ